MPDIHVRTGRKFLVSLPPDAGSIVGMRLYEGRVIILAESDDVYAWDGESRELSRIALWKPDAKTAPA